MIFCRNLLPAAVAILLVFTAGCAKTPVPVALDLATSETAIHTFFQALQQGDARTASACMADNEDILDWTEDGAFLPMMKQSAVEIKETKEQGPYKTITVAITGPDYEWITGQLENTSKNMEQLAQLAQEENADIMRMETLYRAIVKEYVEHINDQATPKATWEITLLTRFSPHADGWVIERDEFMLDALVGRPSF